VKSREQEEEPEGQEASRFYWFKLLKQCPALTVGLCLLGDLAILFLSQEQIRAGFCRDLKNLAVFKCN